MLPPCEFSNFRLSIMIKCTGIGNSCFGGSLRGSLHGMHHAWRFPAPGLDGFVGRCFGLSMSTKSVSRFKLSGRM